MIKRMQRRTTFTVVPNEILTDTRLDWKELGLLCYLLSKPDNWETHPNHLIKQRKTGRDGLYATLKNLRDHGYVKLERNPDGTTCWLITEEPHTANPVKAEKPHPEKPYREKPYRDNPDDIVKTDHVVKTEGLVNTTPRKKLSEQDVSTAQFIFQKILDINPGNKSPNIDKWANTVRLMRERDHRSDEQIRSMFTWANNDEFWKTNILSPEKLRRQWDTLAIRKNSAKQTGQQKHEKNMQNLMQTVFGDDAINSTCERVQ